MEFRPLCLKLENTFALTVAEAALAVGRRITNFDFTCDILFYSPGLMWINFRLAEFKCVQKSRESPFIFNSRENVRKAYAYLLL
jgi:hypothetical protein